MTDSTEQNEVRLSSIGERMKYARKHIAQLTQSELADKLDLKQSYISSVERGEKQFSSHSPEIAEALGVNLRWFMQGKGPVMDSADDDPFNKMKLAAIKYSLSDEEFKAVEKAALDKMQEIFLNRI